MGVRGYTSFIKNTLRLPDGLPAYKNKILLIDGNCIIHFALSLETTIAFSNVESLSKSIITQTKNILAKFDGVSETILCFDGVSPLPKQYCQKKRREFRSSLSCKILPGTNEMNYIETEIVKYFQDSCFKIISSVIEGEGEHKLFLETKRRTFDNQTLVYLTLDSDIIILAQILQINNPHLNIIVHSFGFNKTLILDIKKLNERLKLTKVELMFLVLLCGNDFLPPLISRNKAKDNYLLLLKLRTENTKTIKCFFERLADVCFATKCNDMCDKVNNYCTVLLWLLEYFETNTITHVTPYSYDCSPCVHCILKTLNNNTFEVKKIVDVEDQLYYVLPEDLRL